VDFTTREVRQGSLITMSDQGALLGTVRFEPILDGTQLRALTIRDGFLLSMTPLLEKLPLPLVYIHVLQIGARWQGRGLGLTLLSYCRDTIAQQWPGVPAVAVCKESLVPYWSRMGAVFTGDEVKGYHLFNLGKTQGN